MADVRISDLPMATSVAREDIVPIVQSGSTKQVTISGFLTDSENTTKAFATATASGYASDAYDAAILTASGYAIDSYNGAILTASGYAVDSYNGAVATASGYVENRIDPLYDFREWDITRTYNLNDPTFRLGVPYRSLITTNSGNAPETNPDKWEVTGGGGAGGNENFLKNDLTKANVVGVTGTGTTSVAWDATATDILNAGALKVEVPSGTGVALDIDLDDLDPNQVGQPWKVQFSYKLATAANDLVTVVLWNGTVETPLALGALPYAGGTMQTTMGAVLPTTTLTGQKLRFKFKDSTACTFFLADVSVGPYVATSGAAIGNWKTLPSLTTNANTPLNSSVGWYRRVGSCMEFVGRFRWSTSVAGSGADPFKVTIPEGLQADSAVFIPSTILYPVLGVWSTVGPTAIDGMVRGVNAAGLLVNEPTVVVFQGVTNALIPLSGFPTSVYFTFHVTIPIAQWTSNINMATDFQEFASNGSVSDANNTTFFQYGTAGSPFPGTLTATRQKTIQFSSPVGPTDILKIEINDGTEAGWHSPDGFHGVVWTGFLGITDIIGRQCRVAFARYAFGTTNWSDYPTWKWRVRKISNGNMAEQPIDPNLDSINEKYAGEGIKFKTAAGAEIVRMVSGGIKFPATQVPSADANVLDDYEEGTWTPALIFGSSSSGMTYADQAGNYTKIGRIVNFQCQITLTAKGTATGTAYVTGLPFTSSSLAGSENISTPYLVNTSNSGNPSARIEPNTTRVRMTETTLAGSFSNMNETDFSDTSLVRLSGHYFV